MHHDAGHLLQRIRKFAGAIEDTAGDGLKVNEGRNIVIRRVRTEWTNGPDEKNGAYGIYPVQAENVLLEDSVAIGFLGLFSNAVLLGLPITERAYGEAALAGNYAIIALNAPYCYGLGMTVMEIVRNRGARPRDMATRVLRAMFRNALLIGIAVRMSVLARANEIAIMQTVGATDSYIRRPFLIEGLLTGLAGGLLALVMTFAAHQAVERTLVTLAWLPEMWTAAGLAFAGILGMLAAGRAVRRELRRLDVY